MKIRIIGVFFLLCIIFTAPVFGCIYNVRDIGFADLAPHPYRLFCFIQDNTQQRVVAALRQISYTAFLESNIKAEIINVDQDRSHPAIEYLRFWEIESFPAAILFSPMGRSLVLPLSAPHESFDKAVRSSFTNAIASPIREEILNRIVKSYCVILLIEGKDEAENSKAYEAASRTNRKIAKTMGQLPKRIEKPPCIIVIPQELIPEESLLIWSLGLDGGQLEKPHIAVIYGRGRRMGPLLSGEKITGDRLYKILSVIGLSCDCGLDKKWMMGPLLPLRWDEKIQSDVVKFLGFDVENPMVKTEMSSIISLDLFRQTGDDELRENLGDIFDEYSEWALEFETEANAGRVSPAKYYELTSSGTTQSKSGLNLKTILFGTGIIAFLILAGGSFVLIRARKKLS
ncbi:MAG: hypothetical protein PVF66_05815 [Candidatus Aminicenantes bacterium]|jgi:hypothetical protein